VPLPLFVSQLSQVSTSPVKSSSVFNSSLKVISHQSHHGRKGH